MNQLFEGIAIEDITSRKASSEEDVLHGVDHPDACINCEVPDGCDDTSIYCELVARHNRTADAGSATKRTKSAAYQKKLRRHIEEKGSLPFAEQWALLR